MVVLFDIHTDTGKDRGVESTPKTAIDDAQRALHRRGSSGVLLSSSIQKHFRNRRFTMKNVIKVLRKLFGAGSIDRDQSFLIWAKTEYGKDWRFAYQHLRDYGTPPKKGVHI